MNLTISRLVHARAFKPSLQILVILMLFFVVKAYQQRDVVTGAAPVLQSTLLDGQAFDLQSVKGKPVLLHFFATWCPVCKLQQYSVSALSKDYTVVTVALDSGTDLQLQTYLQQHQLKFPVIADKEGVIANRFGVHGVPTSFIIDPQGEIVFTEVGYTSGWGLRFRLWMAAL
jgi:peroxiredoxin